VVSFKGTFQKLLQKGVSPEDIRAAIVSQKVELVLTAHPTEAQRRSALKKHEQMLEHMKVGREENEERMGGRNPPCFSELFCQND
jgi:phosphoenolpyruvate carboxylase